MIRFIGLYVGLLVLLHLAEESQCTFFPIGDTNGKLSLHHTHSFSHSHSHSHSHGLVHSHSHSHSHSHGFGIGQSHVVPEQEVKVANGGDDDVQGQDAKAEPIKVDDAKADDARGNVDNGGGAGGDVQVEDSKAVKADKAEDVQGKDDKGVDRGQVKVDDAKANAPAGQVKVDDVKAVDVADDAKVNAPGACIQDQGNAPVELAESKTMGTWQLFVKDSGVSAMHMQIMPNNKAIFFDATSLGPSNIKLPPNNCRTNIPNPKGPPLTDCFAHGVIMDIFTGKIRTLKVMSDVWCSSGALDVKGELVSSGGWADGELGLRYVGFCDNCDFRENPFKLSEIRWYGTQVQLPSGEFMVFGGRHAFNFEFIAPEGKPSPGKVNMPFLDKSCDKFENNLYPFIHVAPDGNLFIFANYMAILFDPLKNVVVREYPDLPGGARNYPGSGSAATLPIKLKPGQKDAPDIEFLVCGGGVTDGFFKAERLLIFEPALDTCGRIKFMQPDAKWEIDTMPSRRVMTDMLNLPNGQILMLNGAQRGVSGWTYAEDPNFAPLLYSPDKPLGARFKELQPTNIARMYHSVAALLVTGDILVAGSNSNQNYTFVAKYPTELRVEKFAPPYLDKSMDPLRPTFKPDQLPAKVAYGQPIIVPFELKQPAVKPQELTLSLYKPPFTTHGYSMNQRTVELGITCLKAGPPGQWTATFEAPNGGQLAPPGFYNIFLSFRGVPGRGSWIQLLPQV